MPSAISKTWGKKTVGERPQTALETELTFSWRTWPSPSVFQAQGTHSDARTGSGHWPEGGFFGAEVSRGPATAGEPPFCCTLLMVSFHTPSRAQPRACSSQQSGILPPSPSRSPPSLPWCQLQFNLLQTSKTLEGRGKLLLCWNRARAGAKHLCWGGELSRTGRAANLGQP